MHLLDIIAIFIFLGGLFIFTNIYYLKQPSSIGLMLLAIGLSILILFVGLFSPTFLEKIDSILLEHDYAELLYQIFINFMLFAGALQIDLKGLREEKTAVFSIAITSVVFTTLIVGTLIYFFLGYIGIELNFWYCLVFGALISPTDPIAVTTLIKRFHLSKVLEKRIKSESLINDGIAVVVALVLLDIEHAAEDHALNVFDILYIFGADIGGGVVIGIFLGYVGYRLLEFVDNDHVEIEVLVTLAIVLVGTQIADFVHVSSKLTAVLMGLIISNESRKNVHELSTNDYVFKFWFLIEETLNAMLFVFIGLEVLILPLRLDYFAAGFVAFNLVIFSRYLGVLLPIRIMETRRHFERNTIKIMTWGALRAGMPIAVALSLPVFEGKDLIITMTFVVVVTSILYQGISISRIMYNEHFANDKQVHAGDKL